jgi:para-nitrobenzyl esterase
VFGHGGPKTVDEYKKYLFEDTGKYADQELRAYPAVSDADVPSQQLRLQSDSFAYGAYSMAQAMTRAGQKAYLYYFTYSETGKRANLGAYHGEELTFLSDSFPNDLEHSQDSKKLGQAMRSFWIQFAKTGNPNSRVFPDWPAYDARTRQRFELGRTMLVHTVPKQLEVLEHIMQQVLAESGYAQPQLEPH